MKRWLIDSNIFLEILLDQEKADVCERFISAEKGSLVISDFSLHSIGVILFKSNKHGLYTKFMHDIIGEISIISLSEDGYEALSDLTINPKFDFDDAYQYQVALENNLQLVTMDKDFKRVPQKSRIRFL